MRKLILTATGLVCLASITYFLGNAVGAGSDPEKREEPAYRVALIDMGFVFENYEKLKMRREEFKAEWQSSENKAKKFLEDGQALQEQIKEYRDGSPEHTARENRLAKLKSELETFRLVEQKNLTRKEAKMYHEAFLEVQEVVGRVCQVNKISLVLRFSREELNSSDPPQKVMAGMNRQVIWHREKDDLSKFVLKQLNEKDSSGDEEALTRPERSSKSAIQPTSGTAAPRTKTK